MCLRLEEWRDVIFERDHRYSPLDSTAILSDEDVLHLSSVGPLTQDALASILSTQWPWWSRYSDELIAHTKDVDVTFTPVPKPPRKPKRAVNEQTESASGSAKRPRATENVEPRSELQPPVIVPSPSPESTGAEGSSTNATQSPVHTGMSYSGTAPGPSHVFPPRSHVQVPPLEHARSVPATLYPHPSHRAAFTGLSYAENNPPQGPMDSVPMAVPQWQQWLWSQGGQNAPYTPAYRQPAPYYPMYRPVAYHYTNPPEAPSQHPPATAHPPPFYSPPPNPHPE